MSRKWALGVCVVAAAGLAVLGYELYGSSAKTLTGPPGNAFRLSYPSSWRVAPPGALARLPGHPIAVLTRVGGAGKVTITRDLPERTLDGRKLVEQVDADFSERLEDYRLLSASIVHTSAGSIFVYSYTPPEALAVHTVALVPAGNHSFLLSTIAGPGATGVANQIDGMIRSFRPL
jgi:hypothetical protein